MNPYERIDKLEQDVADIKARLNRVEAIQQPVRVIAEASIVPRDDRNTLHVPQRKEVGHR